MSLSSATFGRRSICFSPFNRTYSRSSSRSDRRATEKDVGRGHAPAVQAVREAATRRVPFGPVHGSDAPPIECASRALGRPVHDRVLLRRGRPVFPARRGPGRHLGSIDCAGVRYRRSLSWIGNRRRRPLRHYADRRHNRPSCAASARGREARQYSCRDRQSEPSDVRCPPTRTLAESRSPVCRLEA